LKRSGPLVGIIMGSRSDWPTLQPAHSLLRKAGIPTEVRIVSAHRTPIRLVAYARSAQKRGLRILIAGAGGAAHLPGMAAALTPLPVLGIPVASKSLRGLDSLLSIAQMPAGIPVATFPIGKKGATAAARFVIALFRHLS
jgi:5-(carboxyamino)imidazole ribonucleotide mutase